MKKLSVLILTVVSLFAGFQGFAQQPNDLCYYTDASGNIWVKGVLGNGSDPTSSYLWTSATGFVSASNYFTDPNGKSIDILWALPGFSSYLGSPFSFPTRFNYYDTRFPQPPCISNQVYWSGQNVSDPISSPSLSFLQSSICACTPMATSGCIYDDGSGNLTITLYFDANEYIVDPTMYIFAPGSSAPITSATGGLSADGLHSVYVFSALETDLAWINACTAYQIYYYNASYWSNPAGGPPEVEPEKFANSIVAGPCCGTGCGTREDKVVYSINSKDVPPTGVGGPETVHFTNGTGGVWDFGDGTYAGSGVDHVIEVTHKYPSAPHTYNLNYNEIIQIFPGVPSSPIINVCQNDDQIICLPSLTVTPSLSPADAPTLADVISNNVCGDYSFTTTFENNETVTISADVNVAGANAQIIWAPGTTPQNYPDPTFTASTLGQYPYYVQSHTYTGAPISGLTIEFDYSRPYSPSGYSGTLTCPMQLVSSCVQAKQPHNTSVTQTTKSVTDEKLAPNPASDVSYLTFTLADADHVEVKVVDVAGRTVATPLQGQLSAGYHSIEIPTSTLPSGIYNVIMQTNKTVTSQKLSVLK